MTADEHHISLRLTHTCRHRADAHFGDELHMHTGKRVGVLEVMDQLLEILDRINVVVRRWANETNAGRAVARLGNPRIHLVARQLSTLARLGSLRHLDLQVVGVHEVFAGDTKAAAGHLLDAAAALRIVQTVAVFAAFAGVALRPDGVHRNSQRLVRLSADAAVAHCTSRETLDDFTHWLNVVD